MSDPKIKGDNTSVHSHPNSHIQSEKDIKAAETTHHEHAPSTNTSSTPNENDNVQIDYTPEDRDARLAARATLQNALHGIPKAQLIKESDEFCDAHGLEEHKDTFRKGALLAQRPGEWAAIDELNAEEKAAIGFEHRHKWMSKDLWWVVGACAMGAAVQGWDQTGSNGANLGFPQEFGINRGLDEPGGAHDQWILGLVNAIPYLSAPIIGCYSSDPLNNLFGRRGAIFIAAIILIATPLAMAFTHTWQELLIVRIFFGIGIGLKDQPFQSSLPLRPSYNGLVLPRIAPLVYEKGRMPEAFKSMKKLRKHDVQAARDLFYAWVQWEAENGCYSSDPLNNLFGRRGAIFIAAIILIATPLAMAFTHTWQELLIVRIFFGIGIGLKGSTIPIFSAEVAPTVVRGALVMMWQLWTTVGIFIGFAANAIVRNSGDITWRLQIGSSFIPAVPLAIMVWFCPESPRWYMRKGRMPEAFKSMKKLRKHDVQAARDLFYAWVQWEAEKKVIGDRSMFRRFADLFTVPRIRRATLAASVLHAGQDLCGINTIAFYSSTIFVDGGASNVDALYASLGFGALNFVFTWPAVFTIDTFGRRTLNLFFFPLMAVSLLAAGMAFYIEEQRIRTGIVALFIYIYTIFYSIGEGPIIFTYSAEVFPLAHRELGQAFPVSINYFVNFLLSLWFPFQLKQFGGPGTFGFYTETKQLSLEELDQVFSVPTSVYINYQFTKWLPWAFKRYVLFNRKEKLEPLFHEDKDIKA
ncbi:hypothetical protein V865_000399 [Kwoniella europaea PYCC6329]|uniref:Major facilitator superfamily (MFS) profile domain-containing protein n=1 Tax=Kwoniella europaea PYCC6329 TaxID=1423913 RepID=A0AAX4K7M2_9TREE